MQTDRDYAENLRILDRIASKSMAQFTFHRKSISQPDTTENTRQPDRLGMVFITQELSVGQHIVLQLYPQVFKYIKIRVKDLPMPINFTCESSVPTACVKVFISQSTDSPSILNHNLYILNKNRFSFQEQHSHSARFDIQYVYLSIYSDKYIEMKFKTTAGHKALPQVINTVREKGESLLKEPGAYSLRRNRQINTLTRSNISYVKTNVSQQGKFRQIQEEHLDVKKQLLKFQIAKVQQKKQLICTFKQSHLIEQGYISDVNRLSHRVSRLKQEIIKHVISMEQEWLSLLYVALLGQIIRKKYFQRVRRIVILNKVQVICRRFARNMKASLSRNYKRTLFINCNLLFGIVGSAIKRRAKEKAKSILSDFMYVYSYQADGLKKIAKFHIYIHTIQNKWRKYKKIENQYYQKCAFLIQSKWYQIFKHLCTEKNIQGKAVPILDKVALNEAIKINTFNYKKQFVQTLKVLGGLSIGIQVSVFRPLNITIMKDIMQEFLDIKNQK